MSWKIGDLCVAKSKQFGWTNSEIKQVNEDIASVEFIEYDGDEEVNISDLKPFGPFVVNKMGELVEGNNEDRDYARWKVGDACVAQWTLDGVWYNSQILHFFNEDEILVRFVDYGNADFTTLRNLKPAGSRLENAACPSENDSKTEVRERAMKRTSFASEEEKSENTTRPWSVFDKCVSRSSEDGLWYMSQILAITGQQVTVLFTQYGNEGVTTLDQLKHVNELEECDEIKTLWKVGDLCVALWKEDDVLYNSQILEIKGCRVLVRFTDYGNEDYTTLDQLKPFGSLDGDLMEAIFTPVKKTSSRNGPDKNWKVGDMCVARWNEDQVWYDSEIVEISGETVLVRFVDYGNEDYTTLEELKPVGSLSTNAEGMGGEIIEENGVIPKCKGAIPKVNNKRRDVIEEKGAIPKCKGAIPKVNKRRDVIEEKGAIPKCNGSIPKVNKGAISKDKKGTFLSFNELLKLPASEKIIAMEEENSASQYSTATEEVDNASQYSTATEEENSAVAGTINVPQTVGHGRAHGHHDTPEYIAEQLQNIFPYYSHEFLLDRARKYGTIENAVNELLNHVQDQDLLREAPKDIAEQLKNLFPCFSVEFLLDKAREYGTIENAVNELLNYVHDQDLLKDKEVENNCVKERVAKSLLLLGEQDMFEKRTLTEKRNFNPEDPLENKFRLAKGHYLSVSGQFARHIESIDYVENRILMEIFERKRSQLKSEGKNTKEYFLFHGTDDVNVDSILRGNFQMDYAGKNGQAHGRGVYFSEKTMIPDEYMKGSKKKLLLCRVLLGKEFHGVASDIPDGFDSKSVKPDKDKRADINVIKEVDQILPCFVLNFGPSALDSSDDDCTAQVPFHRSNHRFYGAHSLIPPNAFQSGANSAIPTSMSQYGANSTASTTMPQSGSNSRTPPTNVPQYGTSPATPTYTFHSGVISALPTTMSQYGASSGRSIGSAFRMARFGFATCPYDASHMVRPDMMQIHKTKCSNRPM